MLIYTSKSPNHGQWKPKQYGPLSEVQYAVRRNTDKFYFNFDDLLALFPGWGDYLPTDLISGQIATPGVNASYSEGINYKTNSEVVGSGWQINNKRITLKQGSPASIILQAKNIYPTTYNKYLYVGFNGNSNQRMFIDANNGYLRASSGAGTPYKILSSFNLVNSNQYAFIKPTYNTGAVYINGSGGSVSSSMYGSNPSAFFLGPSSSLYGGAEIEILTYFSINVLTDYLLYELKERPYALLMPVSRPVFFDMGATGDTGTFTAPSLTVTPTITAGTLSAAQSGAATAPSLSITPTITAGTLTGNQTGDFSAPSLSVVPSISAGTLTGVQAGNFFSPAGSTRPAISAGTLSGAQSATLNAPPVAVAPSVSAGSLTGTQVGVFAAPSATAQPAVSAGLLVGNQSGNFLGPSLVVSPSVTAATLQSLGSGLLSAPQVATRPVVATGTLIGASAGVAQAPSLSTAPAVSAGLLVGNQSGSFLGPSLSLRPDVEAGTLAGVAASSGAFVSPGLSLRPAVAAGVLVGDVVIILPEVFNANSLITGHFAANSLITTEFVAVSQLELGRIQNNG